EFNSSTSLDDLERQARRRGPRGLKALMFDGGLIVLIHARNPMIELKALDEESGHVNAIIDTPKGSRNKFKYDEKLGILDWESRFHWEQSFLSILAIFPLRRR